MIYKSRCKKNYLELLFVLFLISIALFFIVININTPMMGEDFSLVSFAKDYKGTSINNYISLIIDRINLQVNTWNIRIGEQLSIIFGSINIWIYYIGNTVISIGYILLITVYTFGKKIKINDKKQLYSIFLTFCLIVLFQPALGEIFFWRTGSSNYLWAMCILLIFALPLRLAYEEIDVLYNRKSLTILHTMLGLFAGMTNENTVVVFIILYIAIMIFRLKKRKKIFTWMWSSFITLTLGFCVMFLAPSTKIRIKTYNEIFGIQSVTIKDYFYRALNIIERFFSENTFLICVLIVILLIYSYLNYNKIKQEIIKKEIVKYKNDAINLLFLFVSSISAGALVGAPYVETRAFFLIDFFIMSSIVYFSIKIIEENIEKIRFITKIILVVISFCTIVTCANIYKTYSDYSKFFNNNELIIENAKKNNETYVYIHPYKYKNNRILNTREDYLQSNLKYLDSYYGISIRYNMEEMYSYNDLNREFEYIDFQHGVDYTSYDLNESRLQIYGWAALEGQKSEDNNISILLKKNDKIYKFNTNKILRKDVSEYYKDNRYDKSGFSLDIHNITDIIPKDVYILGICITDNKGINYVTYTNNQIDIK